MEWLNRRLAAQGTSPGKVVAQEHHAQGAATATVRHIISSMRWMSSIDWLEFFEKVSLVDDVLRSAPAFAAMDFAVHWSAQVRDDETSVAVESFNVRCNSKFTGIPIISSWMT